MARKVYGGLREQIMSILEDRDSYEEDYKSFYIGLW